MVLDRYKRFLIKKFGRARILSHPRRYLFIGYSVTESNTYIVQSQIYFNESGGGVELIRSGWGGHTIDTIAYMIDSILEQAHCDSVVLELFTSHIRTLDRDRITFLLDQILSACAKRQLHVYFLNLFDAQVEYRDDFLSNIIQKYSITYDIPLIDIAQEMLKLEKSVQSSLLSDNVHLTEEGSRFYGQRVYEFICRQPNTSRLYVDTFMRAKKMITARSVSEISCIEPTFQLIRQGLPLDFIEIPEGDEICLNFEKPLFIEGAILTYAPNAGCMIFEDASSNQRRQIIPFDPHSYYIRSGAFEINLEAVTRLIVRQTPEVPAGELLKGTKDFGPRIGRISHLLCKH